MSRDHSASLPPFQGTPDRGVVFDRADARGYALPFLICLAALTLFRLATLAFSQTELFFDEAQYWFWSRELAFGYYSKPPLIAWIIRGATELCGQGEACIRAPSALIHAATATMVFATARQLYDARTGFWSGLVYATLPGVSLSSSLISTDVPLLFFVALSLLAVVKLQASQVVALGSDARHRHWFRPPVEICDELFHPVPCPLCGLDEQTGERC